MGIRKLKPTTPGQRHKVIGAFDKITASTPEKSLVVGKKSTGGRNNTGKMTMRYLGGGHKQSTDLSISRETKMAFLQQSSLSSMILTVHLVSHCCITQTGQRAISSLRTDWKLAKQWFQVAKPLLRLVILCRWQIFPLVLLFTTLSFVRDRVLS